MVQKVVAGTAQRTALPSAWKHDMHRTLQVRVTNGMLEILQEGRSSKFKARVAGKTFAASSAKGRDILYVTERAVFRLQEGEGLELIEVAPGIDLERDILARMPFRPLMRSVKQMPAQCFQA